MYKKKDLLIILVFSAVLVISVLFLILTQDYISVDGKRAKIDNKDRVIFISLEEGSPAIQEISFSFLIKNSNVYIKKLSCGSEEIGDPVEEKVTNGTEFDFGSYISHSKLIIKSVGSDTEYDLWVTTGEVPIIAIESNGIIADEPKVSCNLSILSANTVYRKDSIASEIELIDISEDVPKCSYSLNIKEDSITGELPSIFDFGTTKRFRLSASYIDRSFLREKLSYDIFKQLSEDNFAPDSRYVELYVDNSYKGLYLIYERADRDMFSLSNYKKSDDVHNIIYEAVNWRADFTNGVEGFSQIEPDFESDKPYFVPLLNLSDYIINANQDEFIRNVEEIINIDSVLNNHILFLLTGCTEELASNNYIYRSNSDKAKFSFGPGSHYLSSFGRDDDSTKIDAETIFCGTRLFNRLYEDEDYRERLKGRWNSLREQVLTTDSIYSLIDESTENLADAQNRNFEKWLVTMDVYGDDFNFSQDIDYIKDFIEKRLVYLDYYINHPPLIKIGDTYAMIDEESSTIFCALPPGSDAVQEINWEFSPDTNIYIEPLSLGKHIVVENKYSEYREMVKTGKNTDEITIYLDRPADGEILDGRILIYGWALNYKIEDSPGVEHVLLFDGPEKNSNTFLGEAKTVSGREDVAKHFNNPAYQNAGFEIYMDTIYLENGHHEIYFYVFDEQGNYSLKVLNIEIDNKNNIANEFKDIKKSRISNNDEYDFIEFIFHGTITIKNRLIEKEYELYITTSDIPLLIIDTPGTNIPTESKINTELLMIYKDPDEKSFINCNIFNYYGPAGIEIRGKSSQLFFPKKQFSIELRDENGKDKDVSLLGMPAESDWVLGAPYSDKTLIRNVLAFELSNQIGMYAAKTEFVEVFLNKESNQTLAGEYMGVYVLTEKIKRDRYRVNVEKLDSDEDDLISGGYILEISSLPRINPDESHITTDRGLELINKYPRGDVITEKQKAWITNYMNEFENVLYGEDFKDIDNGYAKYIDVDSFIDYIIINELFKNRDVFEESTFLYKERNGKLKIGPIWDFNLSSGNHDEESTVNGPTQWRVTDILWTERLFQDENFTRKYIERWKELRKDILSNNNINTIIDNNASSLSDTQVRNFEKWDILGKYIWPNAEPYADTYEEEVEKLKNWFFERTKWIDENIDYLLVNY